MTQRHARRVQKNGEARILRLSDVVARPYIRMCMAISVDGKITTHDAGNLQFGSAKDYRRLQELRAASDAILVGARTAVAESLPRLVIDADLRERRHRRGLTPQPLNAVVTSRVKARLLHAPVIKNDDTAKVIYTTPLTVKRNIDMARKCASVVLLRPTLSGKVDLASVCADLRSRRIENVLLEGGGELNFAMMSKGLVDELFVTVCPFIFGGRTAPTLFGGPGFGRSSVSRLSLCRAQTLATGEIFLHYKVNGTATLFSRGYD